MFRKFAVAISEDLVTTHGMEAAQVKASPFIDFLMGLLKQLLPMLLTCLPKAATAADVHAAIQNLDFWQLWHLRRTVRQHIGDSEMQNYLAGPLVSALKKQFKVATVEDVQGGMDEIAA